ncbi:hypothetical protein PPERSA_02527 [Pseudocohnilembus persalinus]|uniref:Limiting CO2-inducible protein B/C beta carbonyic anhydrase domain-containing protein n=1 Tax=Pseudocohnilembus persalinus TaxID=266149 RepID=A0A0V0R5B0_PSEPJ|nr:hypothetical protein PPERSA_02527 [Pseudocohnilembus persalinus]|eukprot:KRX09655.1 hypothetical protein PPERSA_02527 [Pseudocohnilembus persalinus]
MMFEEKAQIPENLNQINFESKVDENQNSSNNQEEHEHHENESLQPLQIFLQKSIEIIEGEHKQEELVQQQQADEILPQQQQTLASSQPDYISMINEQFKKYTKNSAQKNSQFNEKLSKILNKQGLNTDNTLFGSSICPDEINHGHSSLANLMKNTWGGIMPFGGLGGIPFAGKTGFKAYASHVPDDGNLLVLFAPHVGMDKYGQLGQVERRGQKKVSTSCGAASGAYLHALEESAHEIDGEDDYQLDWISKKMVTLVNRIKH